MNAYTCLFLVRGVVTIAFVGLLMYRSSLGSQDRGWCSMTDDEHECRATPAQTIIEMKARRLTCPICTLVGCYINK